MRTVHSREAFASLREHFGDKVFETAIRASIAYAESAERAVSILELPPRPRQPTTWRSAGEMLTRIARLRPGAQAAAGLQLQLADERALRLERSAQQRRPSRRSRCAAPPRRRRSARRSTRPSTVGPAPEIVAPSAPSSRALRASSSERGNRGARGGAGAGGRCRPRATRSQSPRGEPEHQQRGVRGVEDRVGQRHLGGQRGARRARARPACARHDQQRLQAGGGSKPCGVTVGADDEAAEQRGGDVVGMALELAWPAPAGRRRARTGDRPPAVRRRCAAALEPRPPRSGISERIRKLKPSAGCSRSKARTTRFSRSRRRQVGLDREAGRSPRPRARGTAPSAAAKQSKPGPRFAEDAGTPTRTPPTAITPGPRARSRAARGSHGTTAPTCSSAVCGSFSPWPVSTQAIRSAPSAPYFSRPATDAAEAGSQKTPSLGARAAR